MTALAMAAVITHYDRVRQAPMDVPITWSQTTTYVRKCGGRWWVATCLFVDPAYAMAQQAGHVIHGWWTWLMFPTHQEALAFAIDTL